MITNNPRWIIKLTHIPTGTSVETGSHLFRTQNQAHEAMIKLLKSKLWYCDKSLFSKESYEAELEMEGSDFCGAMINDISNSMAILEDYF